jgi:hypothetical protein
LGNFGVSQDRSETVLSGKLKFAIFGLIGLLPNAVLASPFLLISGGSGFTFKPGGASQWQSGGPTYYQEIYDQSGVTNSQEGHWIGTWSDGSNSASYEGKGISSASANFGTLGVYSYAWVSEKYNYYDWQVNASARSRFEDAWKVDAPGVAPGTVGALSIGIALDGSRTDNRDNHFSNLNLSFGDYSTGSHTGANNVYAGYQVFTIAFKYGQWNNVYMELVGESGSFNQYIGDGGVSYIDFLHTAAITGLTFRDDANGEISNYTMSTASGQSYPVPEPASIAILSIGGVLLTRRRRSV